LDKLPRGLPETYERILSRVLESHEEIHDLVSRTLQWLACAAKALSGRALLEALAIVPGDTCLYLDAMTSEHEILRWCSSLVRRRVTGDGIELAHFTVKEYLLSIDLTKNPKFASFKICQEKSDLLLGQICLTYLNLDNLGKSRPPDDLFDDMRSDLESKGSEESEEYNDHDENKDDDDESSGDSGDCADIDNSRDGKLEHNTGSVTQKGGPQGASLGHEKADQLESTADVAFRPWLDKYPLLQYAANGWYSHLRVYSEDPLVVRLTHKLFDPRKSYQFLWWSYAFLCNNLGFHGETTFPDSTTLHWAALFSLHDVCSWLIEEGADVNRISSLGAPLDCALLKMAALWELDEIDCHEYMDEYHDSSLPRMQIARSTVIIVQKLIQAGARVDRTTNPNFPARPLKMALITDSHNAELISHILEGGALVDEDVLTVVEEYLDRNSDRLSTGTVPSGISALFSRVAYQDVSYATQPIYRKLSSQLAGSLSSTHETGSFSPKQLHTESDIKSLKQRFFQASEHGVYDGVESLMSSLRNLYPEDTQSTLTSGLVLALENNHKDVAHLLLSNGVNPNIADNYENSPLHRIIRDYSISDVNIVIQNIKSLVDHGADLMIKNRNGELPLHLAAKSKHEGPLKTILEVMSDESTQISLAGHDPSPLQYAVAWGADENVRLLLEKYETISPMDHRSKDGRSLMAHAATRKTAFVVRLLYQRGLTTNTVSTDGSSVLYSATSCSSEDPFNFLMDIGAIDISARRDGKKAIHEAVTNQITSTSKLAAILQAGEDPNLQMADGSTPLHLIFNEYAAIEKFQLLVNHERININCRDRKGMTPLMIYSKFLGSYQLDNKLAKRHLVQGIECLINHKADVTLADLNDDRTALHHLCLNGVTSTSFDITKLFVNSGGASLYSTDRFRITPFELLFVTCIDPTRKEKSFPQSEDFDPSDVLRFIINNASDHLNDKLSTRIPPLNFALKHGNATAVDILLEQEQVNVDIRGGDRDQLTALEIAASSGCTENIARVLLSRTDNSIYGFHPLQGYTLLHFAACDKSNQMVLRKLLERNVDIETLNRAGNTPLHIAILLENLPAVRLLLKEGANITAAVGNLDLCPLHLAASTGNLRIVESLILSGADINASSPQSGLTALHYASNRAPWSLISFLLQKGANIDARNNAGATPCLVAAQAKRWDIVRKYANTTADFNSKNFDGLGVLHYAVLSSAISIVEFLRRQGISLRQDITDHDGKVHGNTVICAAIAGNVDLFQMAWEDNAINFMNDYGWGLAHFAMCASGNGVRDLLLPYNVDWTLNTAIYYSCSKASHLRFEPKGLLPLHMAAAGGNNSAINFLNDNNLVPSMDATTGRDGHYSSLHLAVIFNRLSTVKLLKTLGADLDLKDHNEEQTALHHAAQLGFAEIVTSLLDAGCQPNPVDVNGMTPESLALENGHEAVTAVISRHLDSLETKLDSVEGEHPSASVLESSRGKQGKPWRISLAQTTHMRRVMTGNLSIYAIDDIECPEELHTMLAKNKDHGVYNLGKTFHKSIS
jgi:ankyrin repeat protein